MGSAYFPVYGVNTDALKVLMQGKLITVAYIEASSLWADFANKNRCISVRLVS